MKDQNWPERCSLQGCEGPGIRPHHHHMEGGHLSTYPCKCPRIDQPGTKPNTQCGSRTPSGWGGMKYCLFVKGHSGQHSWVVS